MYNKRTILIAATLLIASIFFSSCDKDDENSPIPTNTLELIINGENMDIDISSGIVQYVDAVTLNTEFDNVCKLRNSENFTEITVNGKKMTNGQCLFRISKINKDTFIPITYATTETSGTIYIRTRNSNIPQFNISGISQTNGNYYMSFVYMPLIMKLDKYGNILFYRWENPKTGYENDNVGFWDFKKHVINGTVYYSYHAPDYDYSNRLMNGYNPGMRILLDSTYNRIDCFKLKASSKRGIQEGEPIDGHDFILIDRNHYIMSSYIKRHLSASDFPSSVAHSDDGCYVAAAYLQEVNNGSIVFDWCSSDHPEMTSYSDTAFGTSNFNFYNQSENYSDLPDYVHFNSMQIDPKDNNLICSFRHISTIFKINRITGDIIWTLSGKGDEFNMTSEQHTCGQHYVKLMEDGTLTAFDNHNSASISRILRMVIDENSKKIVTFYTPIYGKNNFFAQACGSATILDGYLTVGWGIGKGIFKTRLLSEMDLNGNTTFEINWVDYNLMGKESSYRVARYN